MYRTLKKMNFREDSKIIKKLFSNFKKRDDIFSEKSKTFLDKIYKIMRKSLSWQPHIVYTKLDALPKGTKHHIISEELRNECEEMEIFRKYEFYIGTPKTKKHKISVYLSSMKSGAKEFPNVLRKIKIWLFTLMNFIEEVCSPNINIYLYFTHHKKMLPDSSNTIIDESHANTAFTYACNVVRDSNDIYIYRQEEWFKVLIHETFHAFGLDFSAMNQSRLNKQIHSVFPVNNDPSFYETYTEVWAEILNMMVLTLHIIDKEKWINKLESKVFYESLFAQFQCAKILDFMGIEYSVLWAKNKQNERDTKYKENTNVMAYFLFKSAFFYKINDFVEWCVTNNNSSLRFNKRNDIKFFDFLLEIYNSEDYLQTIKNMKDFISNQTTKKKDGFVFKTLRMSMNE